MKTNESEYKRLDNQLLSLMTHVHAFLKGRLTLGELGEAEERAEIFRTNQATNYDEVLRDYLQAQIEQENAELRKDKERLDFILKNCTIEYDRFYRTYFDNRDEIDEVMQMEELI